MRIESIVVGDRTRRDMTKIEQLAKSIERVGLLQPPVVREVGDQYHLVAGGRRLAAMRHLGWTTTKVTVAHDIADELTALLAEGEENTEREPFTVAEAVEHRRRIREVESRLAKERQGARTDLRKSEPSTKLDEGSRSPTANPKRHANETRHRTAKATGFGATTLDKAESIIDAATSDETPEPVRKVAQESAKRLDQHGAKVDREKRNLDEALASHIEGDQSVADARYRANLTKALGRISDVWEFEAERVLEVADTDTLGLIDQMVGQLDRWHERIKSGATTGLRVVNGGRQ